MRSRCSIALLALSLLALGLLAPSCREKAEQRLDMTRYVMIYPGAPIVELPGESTELRVTVRNVSEVKLTGLQLAVKSEACSARVTPQQLAELAPGDRTLFTARLTRRPQIPLRRYPLALTLHAGGLPVPAGLDLQLDSGPALDRGWIDVGQVTLMPVARSRTAIYLLAGIPLLLLVGWLLLRWSRVRSRKNSAVDTDPR